MLNKYQRRARTPFIGRNFYEVSPVLVLAQDYSPHTCRRNSRCNAYIVQLCRIFQTGVDYLFAILIFKMQGKFSVEWLAQSSHGDSSCTRHCWGNSIPESRQATSAGQRPDRLAEKTQKPHGSQTECEAPPRQQSLPPKSEVSTLQSVCDSEETSGYESERCRSASPSSLKDEGRLTSREASAGPPTVTSSGRRPRTAFTTEQINKLENIFKKQTYVGTREKEELCKKLSLSEKQIKNWFQNRRMKLKRAIQDAMAQACHVNVSAHLPPYPELRTFGPTPYVGFFPGQDPSGAFLPVPQYPAPFLSPATMDTSVHPLPALMVSQSEASASHATLGRYHPYGLYY
ncbi:VENT1 protein, partial [Polypterus senegalus]|nr:VENT1 protein [Polypterus senegalus]